MFLWTYLSSVALFCLFFILPRKIFIVSSKRIWRKLYWQLFNVLSIIISTFIRVLMYFLSVLVKESLSSHFFNILSDQRVDRVLSFFSSCPNWDSPTPFLRVPPFFGSGGGKLTLWGERGRGSQYGRGDRHSGTLGIYVLVYPNLYNLAADRGLNPYF